MTVTWTELVIRRLRTKKGDYSASRDLSMSKAGVPFDMLREHLNNYQEGLTVSMARLSKARRREAVEGYLYLLPWLLGFLIFTAGPMLTSLYLSFTEYRVTSPPTLIG